MFNQRELEVLVLGLDSLRVDLVKLHSASKEVGMSVERVKNEIEEVEVLSDKIRKIIRFAIADQAIEKEWSAWNIAQDLCINKSLTEIE